jgi:hypothetical protein
MGVITRLDAQAMKGGLWQPNFAGAQLLQSIGD